MYDWKWSEQRLLGNTEPLVIHGEKKIKNGTLYLSFYVSDDPMPVCWLEEGDDSDPMPLGIRFKGNDKETLASSVEAELKALGLE